MHIYIYIYVYRYIYIYILYRERERIIDITCMYVYIYTHTCMRHRAARSRWGYPVCMACLPPQVRRDTPSPPTKSFPTKSP